MFLISYLSFRIASSVQYILSGLFDLLLLPFRLLDDDEDVEDDDEVDEDDDAEVDDAECALCSSTLAAAIEDVDDDIAASGGGVGGK